MKQISIEIIHKCPNKCLHCSSYSNINCALIIETEKVKQAIDSASKLETEVLSISGGEPFLHTGLLEIVQYAKEKGINTYVYTSGVVLNDAGEAESINMDLLKKLHNLSVDKIIFDLPAINESIYDKFMGTRGYQKYALESIRRVQKLGIFTEIHFVPTRINVGEVDNILKFAEKAGIDKVSFLGLIPHGRASQNKHKLVLKKKENDELKIRLKNIVSDRIRIGIPLQVDNEEYCCYAGKSKLCIRYDGKVFGCEAFKYIQLLDENNKTILPDSIYERSLEDIYTNSEYLRYERKFIEQQMSECNCGEKCPVQRMMRKESGV